MVNNDFKIDVTIDTKDLPCPIPSMRMRMQLLKIPPDSILKVITTAQHTKKSFPRICKNFNHTILHTSEENGVITYIIQKKSGSKD